MPVPGGDAERKRMGFIFIDALYALAFVEIVLQVHTNPRAVPVAAWGQLGVAGVLITMSWVGYRNSKLRVLHDIKFWNIALAQFFVDVLIVCAYFALVITAPGLPDVENLTSRPSVVPGSTVLVVIYVLYIAWDLLEIALVPATDWRIEEQAKADLVATIAGLVCSVVVAACAFLLDPHSSTMLVLFEVGFGLVIVVHRSVQGYVARQRSSASAVGEPGWSELDTAAEEALAHAYAPHSEFRVGAALRLAGGRVITGCNVENDSFGLSMCAERAAVFRSVVESERPPTIEAVLVRTESGGDAAPCGACRQVLAQLCPGALIRFREAGETVTTTVQDLLPHPFLLKGTASN